MHINNMVQNLTFKMLLSGGLTFFICTASWATFNVANIRDFILRTVKSDIVILSDTILLGLDYAMLLDSEDDIKQITTISAARKISRQSGCWIKKAALLFQQT